jgi:sugar phosphate permease
MAQAGAYPTSGGVIRRWIPIHRRGFASGCVSLGGRLGGTVAPYFTAVLIFQLGDWRSVLTVYFAIGIVIAIAYWWVVRDTPDKHPLVNEQERLLIGEPLDSQRPTIGEFLIMLTSCVLNRSLWLNSLQQFAINIGWAFLITWLPSYLTDTQDVSPIVGATMVTLVLASGIPGQLIGGYFSDRAVMKFGLRWGRVIVPAIALTIAGLSYLTCLTLTSVWLIIGCCAMVSVMTDIANPSTWAFMQDVGGRNTAAVYGWANMWGNFGAAFSAMIVPYLMRWGEASGNGQDFVFIVCGSSFFLAAIFTLGMDATRPLRTSRLGGLR